MFGMVYRLREIRIPYCRSANPVTISYNVSFRIESAIRSSRTTGMTPPIIGGIHGHVGLIIQPKIIIEDVIQVDLSTRIRSYKKDSGRASTNRVIIPPSAS